MKPRHPGEVMLFSDWAVRSSFIAADQTDFIGPILGGGCQKG
jgi:hypothetical protein